MHADGYARFEELYRSGRFHAVACMAHIRRKFVDVQQSQGSAIAEEAIRRIAELYAVEKEARGLARVSGSPLKVVSLYIKPLLTFPLWGIASARPPVSASYAARCFQSESPRVYRRVKLSKDEPYDTEKAPPVLHG
jgi:hypothetical protein